MHKIKSAPITEFKATGDAGTFEALVAVFGNVDYGGDRILPGAFTDSLKAWSDSGDPIPVIWSHQWADPDMHIGSVTAARETDAGLVVTGSLDLDAPVAAQVYRLLKARRVKQFSFAYDVVAGVMNERDGVYDLAALDVFEVGPTLRGMNPATELGDVKAADVHAPPAAKAAAIDEAAAPPAEQVDQAPPEAGEAEAKTAPAHGLLLELAIAEGDLDACC